MSKSSLSAYIDEFPLSARLRYLYSGINSILWSLRGRRHGGTKWDYEGGIVSPEDLKYGSLMVLDKGEKLAEIANRIKDAAKSIRKFNSIPFDLIEKAIEACNLGLSDELVRNLESLKEYSEKLKMIHSKFDRPNLKHNSLEKGASDLLKVLISSLDELAKIPPPPGAKEILGRFMRIICRRYHYSYGWVKCNFVFFPFHYGKSTIGIRDVTNLLLDQDFLELLRFWQQRFGNITFDDVYKKTCEWFFQDVIIWTLNKERHLFESLYGPNYHLDINIYFVVERLSNFLMAIPTIERHFESGVKSEVLTIVPSVDARNFIVAADLPPILMRTPPGFVQSAFIHEIAHILDQQLKQIYLGLLGQIRSEGLATLVHFASSPAQVVYYFKNAYDKILQEAINRPILPSDESKTDRNIYYCLGLHMWLVIYISKLNLARNPNLTILTEDIGSLLQGNYQRFFYAWLHRFSRMDIKQFLKQYSDAIKKLGMPSIIDTSFLNQNL